MIALLPVADVLWICDIILLALRAGLADGHQPSGVHKRHRPEQNGVYYAENGSVRANSENQRKQRDSAEARTLPQDANREAKVLPDAVHSSGSGATSGPIV